MTSDNGGGIPDPVLNRRMTVPDPTPGYFDRPALTERLTSTDHPIAVLRAPGGFGKTALLASLCQQLIGRGIPAAWLQMDEGDTREQVETCLALAFRHAGVDVPALDSEEWCKTKHRIELLSDKIDTHNEPCTLALDNVELLTGPDGSDAISTLLREPPPNLRMILACRELPPSLDLLKPLLAGHVDLLSVAELRFSAEETATFLGRHLSDRGLAAIDQEYAGWPIALALLRAVDLGAASYRADSTNLLGNWIESRLWRGLSTDQRDFLLDAGLLDEISPALLDEVLEYSDSLYRLQAMAEFDGLVQASPGCNDGTAVLHPLLRRHCAARRSRETPERFKTIHHRAALVLEQRGDIFAAMHHAAESGDTALLGRLIEDAGGIRLWTRTMRLASVRVIASLTRDVVKHRPRVALYHAHVLAFTDRIPEARSLYDLAAKSSENFTRNPTGDVRDLHIDHIIIEMAFFIVGYTPLNNAQFQSTVARASEIAQDDGLDAHTRACLLFMLCIYEIHLARFDTAFALIEQIRQLISGGQGPRLSLHIDLQLGNMAMAQGHAQDAETYYTSVLRSAQAHYSNDPVAGVIGDALLRELQFERNRLTLPIAAGMSLHDNYTRPGNTFATQASECVIICEVTQYTTGIDEVLSVLIKMTEYVRQKKRQTLVRYLAALRVDLLATAGRTDEASRAWRAEALPSDDADCLDMKSSQDWREVEMIACARLRLYTVCEEFEAGRRFGGQLLRVTETHRLMRTAMRVYAILMALEWRAGDQDAACAHLEIFLRHYARADYARPILREADVSRQALQRLLESQPHGPTAKAVGDLLKMLAANETKNVAGFNDREMSVLKMLPYMRDKQIASELSISREGVRYYLRQIYTKLNVHNRSEAVQLAQSIGLILQ